MTPTPADIITDPNIGAVLAWVGVGFAAAASILGVLLKMLLSSYKKNTELQLKTVGDTVNSYREYQKECDERTAASVKGCSDKIENQRDRWENFLKEYHIMDTSRGQKVDALFRTVDVMRETLKELRPGLYSKVEEISERLSSELKLYVRDIMKKEG